MALKSVFSSPGASMGAAIGTAGLVYAIYALNVPNLGLIHATDPHDRNVEASRKKAAIEAGLAAAAVSILTKDLNPWILGGGAIIVSDWWIRHANATHPETGAMVSPDGYSANSQGQGYGVNNNTGTGDYLQAVQ